MHDNDGSLFLPVLVVLAAVVVFVPLFKRLGLGAILGYLAAGVLLGPSVMGLSEHPEEIMQIGELGIVFLLFLIGLELNPSRLWRMRRDIFGLGALQIVVSAAAIMTFPLFVMDRPVTMALVAGLGLALSSTAIAMQIIEEHGAFRLPWGQRSFAILLMQDLAIVPLLALVTFLSPVEAPDPEPLWLVAGRAAAAFAGVILVGRYLLNPLLRVLARTGGTEVMTAAALLVVIAAGSAMVAVGLSMAMGAFLAGVLLADSSYRTELEANIEPFRGVLLGLFFLSVGMSVDLGVVRAEWAIIAAGVASLIVFKSATIYALLRVFGSDHATAMRSGLLLSQGGEFGFILFSAAAAQQVVSPADASLLVAGVTLSMALTPLLVRFGPRLFVRETPRAEPDEDFTDAGGTVLLVGFGRFGQIAAQLFLAANHTLTLLDRDVDRVEEARRFGSRVFFGDGTRLDVLRAAGAGTAGLVAVCTDAPEVTNRIVALVRSQYPDTPVFARSYDRRHSIALAEQEVTYERRETFDSAIAFARAALVELGMDEEDAADVEVLVRRLDAERLAYQRRRGLFEGHREWRAVTPEPFTQLERLRAGRRERPEPPAGRPEVAE